MSGHEKMDVYPGKDEGNSINYTADNSWIFFTDLHPFSLFIPILASFLFSCLELSVLFKTKCLHLQYISLACKMYYPYFLASCKKIIFRIALFVSLTCSFNLFFFVQFTFLNKHFLFSPNNCKQFLIFIELAN